MNNTLIFGDNIAGLQYLLDIGFRHKIDLIYIDPPFATGLSFTINNGRASTISNTKNGTTAYEDKLKGEAFVESIKERLLLARELLSPQGSLYLHTDYKIGHYLKVMMDEVFGIENFRNDITRIKCNPKNFSRLGYGNIKDMILFYTKGKNAIWNEPYEPYTKEEIERLFPKTDDKGRRYTTVPIHAPGESTKRELFCGLLPPTGRHWRTDIQTLNEWNEQGLIEWSANNNPRKKIYLDEKSGKRLQDIWQYKDPLYPKYPTEKNLDLLKMIIATSSNIDSIVLDFYCGSGTTLEAAMNLGRKWIGIDASEVAISTVKQRLGLEDNDLFCNSYNMITL